MIAFFSRRLVCRSTDRSYNSTDSSLVIVYCQLHFLTLAVVQRRDHSFLAYRVACVAINPPTGGQLLVKLRLLVATAREGNLGKARTLAGTPHGDM